MRKNWAKSIIKRSHNITLCLIYYCDFVEDYLWLGGGSSWQIQWEMSWLNDWDIVAVLFSEITVINFSLYDLEVRASLSCQRDDGLITLNRWVLRKKIRGGLTFLWESFKSFWNLYLISLNPEAQSCGSFLVYNELQLYSEKFERIFLLPETKTKTKHE